MMLLRTKLNPSVQQMQQGRYNEKLTVSWIKLPDPYEIKRSEGKSDLEDIPNVMFPKIYE